MALNNDSPVPGPTPVDSPTWKRKLLRRLGRGLRWVGCAYLGVLILMMSLERMMVYPAPTAEPADVHASDHQAVDVYFVSADGTQLHGWYFPSSSSKGQLMYCHGNGDMVLRLGNLCEHLRQSTGYDIFVFDYRGYGLSAGKPYEAGVLADARAARKWLADQTNVAEDQIVLMGRSIGGGVAVDLAASDGAAGLVLQNTFSSLPAVAAAQFPWLPVRWLMRNRYNSIAKIADYHGPLLQSHGDADRLVPISQARQLYEAANSPKSFFLIEGGDHNDPEPAAYWTTLSEFLRDL